MRIKRVLREKLGVAPEIVDEFEQMLRREAVVIVARAPSLDIALWRPTTLWRCR